MTCVDCEWPEDPNPPHGVNADEETDDGDD